MVVSSLLVATLTFAAEVQSANPERPWIGKPGDKPLRMSGSVQFGQIIDDVVGGPVGQPINPLDFPYGTRRAGGPDELEPFLPYNKPVVPQPSIPPEVRFQDTTGEFGGKGEPQPTPNNQGARMWPGTVYPGGPEIPVPPETRRQSADNTGGLAYTELEPEFWLETGKLWKALTIQDQKQALTVTLTALTAGTAYVVLSNKAMRQAARRAVAVLGPVGALVAFQQSAQAAEQAAEIELQSEAVTEFFNNFDHAEALIAIQGKDMLNFYQELSLTLQAAQAAD